MTGDLYIAAVPRSKTKWRLKKVSMPSDMILYEGTKQECERELKRLNKERTNGMA